MSALFTPKHKHSTAVAASIPVHRAYLYVDVRKCSIYHAARPMWNWCMLGLSKVFITNSKIKTCGLVINDYSFRDFAFRIPRYIISQIEML
jgi:hypothetical protein